MSFRILLVDPDSTITPGIESALVAAGHRIARVSTFEEATLQLSPDGPDLLVTSVRLGAFNGMHLLFRFRADRPDGSVVLIGTPDDLAPDLRRQATRFLNPPIDGELFIELVSELLSVRAPRRPHGLRRWPRKRTELPATVHRHLGRVVELSYGGLRLEMPVAPDDVMAPIEIDLPSLGLQVQAVPRWSRPAATAGAWWCGAEIALAGSDAASAWHRIVDAVQ